MRRVTLECAVLAALALAGAGCTHGTEMAAPKANVPEERGAAKPTRESGQQVADALMAQWKRQHPERDWVEQEHVKHVIQAPADNGELVGRGQGATYGTITRQDVEVWDRELKKAVAEGSRIFHDADALGSPIAVSCDMCHPDASNTHPETYPKFQVQMGRVVLLRDMINWCVQHPVRGEALPPDGPKLRALEAYILAQRRGKPLDYGRR